MKPIIPGLALLLAVATAHSQTKTTEERVSETETTVDSTTGKVTTIEKVSTVESTEDVSTYTHMIYVDPIKFVEVFNVGYQYASSPLLSVGGSVQALTQLSDHSGWGVAVEGRFYPGKNPFRSFHLTAGLHYDRVSLTRYNWNTGVTEEATINPIGMNVNLGWNWWPFSDFAVELAIGGDVVFNGENHSSQSEVTSSDLTFINNNSGVMPSARVQIGYAW